MLFTTLLKIKETVTVVTTFPEVSSINFYPMWFKQETKADLNQIIILVPHGGTFTQPRFPLFPILGSPVRVGTLPAYELYYIYMCGHKRNKSAVQKYSICSILRIMLFLLEIYTGNIDWDSFDT